jgi:hypothetical protein
MVHFFGDVHGIYLITKRVLANRPAQYQQWVDAFARNHRIPIQWPDPNMKKKDRKKEDFVRPYGLAMSGASGSAPTHPGGESRRDPRRTARGFAAQKIFVAVGFHCWPTLYPVGADEVVSAGRETFIPPPTVVDSVTCFLVLSLGCLLQL